MKIKFKKLDNNVNIPSFKKEGDAGMDICSNEDVVVSPGEIKAVASGFCVEVPRGYVVLIWDRSGLALKNGIKTMGGVIDSGFRGEVKVIMTNLSKESFKIEKGDRIAQMLIQKNEEPEIEITEGLSDSHRGEDGFGSSGVK